MYDDAMESLIENIIVTSPGGLTYASDMKFGRLEYKMEHLACFAGNAAPAQSIINITHHSNLSPGGLFALGSVTQQDENSAKYMEIGKNITNTCHESYIRTTTRLGPDVMR